ncbi:WXG100 family type VII secretion target [Bacillaceae bacterium Marseille-Q3522]|nr:WXG100 family type VII secretion target [Bacillaceae bacterium Marseille-Q3522]
MAGHIRVTPEELISMSRRYENESGEVEQQIRELDDMISQLQDMWKGAASEAFAEQYEGLRPSIVDMQRLLHDVSVQLENTAKALEDADSQIASQIRG